MQQMIAVGLGGSAGALARYALTGAVYRKYPELLPFPFGTLVVNVLGCLVIGILMTLVAERDLLSENVKLLLITGFLGSLTTFSTFGYETLQLLADNNLRFAFWNVAANICCGFAAVFSWHWLTKLLL